LPARGEVFRAEVLDDLVPRLVVGEHRRNANGGLEPRACRIPPQARALFFRRIEDSDRRTSARERQPEIAAPPNVAGERLDAERRERAPTGEGLEAGGVGRKQN
jgi:hypothetical protein